MTRHPGDTSAANDVERGDDNAANAPRVLTPAAQRALAEAAERRALRERKEAEAAREVGGREGPDPVRYGDWENKGIVSDF